ncbi:MAG: prepilin-type N-terminal cleavage/methylation domain-containing protein [Planctomycetes bacterium]|nr:prepilin-type N-terminal cleavage/methylation domain-containing protein [Planctomycetota bacterium]
MMMVEVHQSIARRKTAKRPRAGFTLIELVVSITVSVIICGLAGSLLWNATQQRSEISARGELIDMGASALEIMTRYLREIPQNECVGNPTPCLAGHAQVTTASSTQIRWGTYGFRKSGTDLEMTTNSGTTWYKLCGDVSSLTLSYYNRTGQNLLSLISPADDPQNMRRITISLTLVRSSQTAKLTTDIYLRNFMNEVTSDP